MKLRRMSGLVAGTLFALGTLQTSASASTETAPTDDCPAARVTGLSVLLDVMTSGSSAGPSVFYGAAVAALSQPLPEPFGAAQAQLLAASGQGVDQFRAEAPGYIEQFRSAVAPLAAGNEFANQGVVAFADGVDAIATAGGKAIAPGDQTLHQIATMIRVAQEKPAEPC